MKVQGNGWDSSWPTGTDWPVHEAMTQKLISTPSLSGLRRFGLYPNPPSTDQTSLTSGDAGAGTVDTNPFPYATTIIGVGLTAALMWWAWPKKGR